MGALSKRLPMFTIEKRILFQHCDHAGIVFYPQYFYLLSEAMEEFMLAAGKPQHEHINVKRRGWPIVKLDVDFVGMSRYGETVSIDVIIRRIGGASMAIDYRIRGANGDRLRASTTIVHVDLETDKAIPISDDLRAAFEPYRVTP
ncbi:MAG: acyl-CoA thioesterase [Burkholderiaceae bacterium]